MLFNYQMENALTRLNNDLDDARKQIEAWETVKKITKKDGKPFKNLSQNFEGERMRFYVEDYHIAPYEKTIAVYYRSAKGSQSATIDCYRSIESTDDREALDQSRIFERGACLKDGYAFSPDEVMQAINNRKEQLKRYADDLEKAINEWEGFKAFMYEIDSKIESLSDTNKQLYYTAREIMRKNY